MLKLLFITLSILCCTITTNFAQTDTVSQHVKRNKLVPGINYHLQLSFFEFSPTLTFPVHKRVTPGVGLNYIHYYRNNIYKGKSSLGLNVFTKYYVLENIYAHGEYVYARVPYLNELNYEFAPVTTSSLLLGAGYRQPITKTVYAYFTVLGDLLNTAYSPFKHKILFRLSVTF